MLTDFPVSLVILKLVLRTKSLAMVSAKSLKILSSLLLLLYEKDSILKNSYGTKIPRMRRPRSLFQFRGSSRRMAIEVEGRIVVS